jgi:hypothetical protein
VRYHSSIDNWFHFDYGAWGRKDPFSVCHQAIDERLAGMSEAGSAALRKALEIPASSERVCPCDPPPPTLHTIFGVDELADGDEATVVPPNSEAHS